LKKRKEKKPKTLQPVLLCVLKSFKPMETTDSARNCKNIKEGKKAFGNFIKGEN